MAGPGNILITVGAQTVEAVRNLGTVNKALGDTQTTSEKMSAGLKKAAVPAAAALAAIGYAGLGAAKAAMEDADSADHLAQTMKRVAGSHQPAIDAMEDYISKTEMATGVADDKLRPAMEKLITATGDSAEAQKLMNQVMDISAATGKDVDTVSTAVAKGYEGQTSSLARLVPGLSEASRKSKDFTVIMDELSDKTGGAAAKAADTAAGKMARFQVSVSELQESIGYALLPVIEALVPLMIKAANFAEENTTAIKALAAIVAVLAGGILAANVAMKAYEAAQVAITVATKAWQAAQLLLNIALDANPIGAVTLAVAALAAGIVLAYQKSETFRDTVKAALNAVREPIDSLAAAWTKLYNAAQFAFNWIVDHWKLALFSFGPIGAAIYALATNWDSVSKAASDAAAAVQSAVATIAGAVAAMARAIRNAVSSSLGWLGSLIGKLDAVVSAVRDVLDWLDKIHVPHLPGLPHIPTPWMPAPASSSRSGVGTPPASRTAPGAAIIVNVYGALDPEGVARQIRRLLADHDRRQGLAVA
jgi:hypothetical protein